MPYRVLNQIFYKNNKFDDPVKIDELHRYTVPCNKCNICIGLNNSIIEPLVAPPKAAHEPIVTKEIQKESFSIPPKIAVLEDTCLDKKTKWFEPKQKDCIFWCIFTEIYGYSEYLMVGSRYGNREMDEKLKMVNYFQKSPKLLKTTNHKVTTENTNEILAEYLSIQNHTTVKGLIGLAVYYKIRIYIVNEQCKLYMKYECEDATEDTKTCILFRNKNIHNQIKYYLDMSIEDISGKIKQIETTMYCLEHYAKDLRPISTYKLCDLEEIAKKLDIPIDAKQKKQDLYDKIRIYIFNNTFYTPILGK